MTRKSLGPEHPSVATSLNNLAELYRSQGRYESAEPLYVEALAIAERVLGKEHPNTKIFRENYQIFLEEKEGREGGRSRSMYSKVGRWIKQLFK